MKTWVPNALLTVALSTVLLGGSATAALASSTVNAGQASALMAGAATPMSLTGNTKGAGEINETDGPAKPPAAGEVDSNLRVNLAASSSSSTMLDAACVKAVAAVPLKTDSSETSTVASSCTTKVGYTQTAAKHPTAAQVEAIGLTAEAASTIWYRDWSEYTIGATWKEIHNGREFWSGYHVWERHLFDGYEGWHRCDVGDSYGFGYSVDVTQCYTSPTLSTYRVQSYDVFKVSVAFHGFPISYTHSMHTNMYPSGTITYH